MAGDQGRVDASRCASETLRCRAVAETFGRLAINRPRNGLAVANQQRDTGADHEGRVDQAGEQ